MSRHKNTAKVQIEEDEIETGSEESEDDDSLEEVIEEEEEEKPKKRVVRKRRPRKQTTKATTNAIPNGNLGLGIVPNGQQITNPNPFVMQQMIPQSNNMSHDQYRQIAEGVVQVFENTLMTAMSYNYALNSVTLVHAYRALKLMNVLQFPAALEAANMAATHDITWVNFRDSILQANRIIGIRI